MPLLSLPIVFGFIDVRRVLVMLEAYPKNLLPNLLHI